MYVNACFLFGHVQDPSYDLFGFAKIATRTASSQAGAAAACPTNVQKFFVTLFARAQSPAGLELINTDLNLCLKSHVGSYTQVNQTLAKYFQNLWVSGVSCHLPIPYSFAYWEPATHPTALFFQCQCLAKCTAGLCPCACLIMTAIKFPYADTAVHPDQ